MLKLGGVAGVVDSVSVGSALLDTYLQTMELLRDPSHVRSRSRSEWDDAIIRAGLVPGAVHPFRMPWNSPCGSSACARRRSGPTQSGLSRR